jgi:hypothetical protein
MYMSNETKYASSTVTASAPTAWASATASTALRRPCSYELPIATWVASESTPVI